MYPASKTSSKVDNPMGSTMGNITTHGKTAAVRTKKPARALVRLASMGCHRASAQSN